MRCNISEPSTDATTPDSSFSRTKFNNFGLHKTRDANIGCPLYSASGTSFATVAFLALCEGVQEGDADTAESVLAKGARKREWNVAVVAFLFGRRFDAAHPFQTSRREFYAGFCGRN